MDKIYLDEDFYDEDYLEHHGIIGMKWGVRRYQNTDGSLTPAGRARRGLKGASSDFERGVKRIKRDAKRNIKKLRKTASKTASKISDLTKKKQRPKSEEEKLRAIKNGDFKTLSRYMDELTLDQLREADARLSLMRNMNQNYAAVHPQKTGVLKKIANTANTIGDVAQGVSKIQQALQLDKKSKAEIAKIRANINKTNAEIKKINRETPEGKKQAKEKEQAAVNEASNTLSKIIDKAVSSDKDSNSGTSSVNNTISKVRDKLLTPATESSDNYNTNSYWKEYRQKKAKKDYNSRYDDFVNNFDRKAVTEYAKSQHRSMGFDSGPKYKSEWDWMNSDNDDDETIRKRRKYEL